VQSLRNSTVNADVSVAHYSQYAIFKLKTQTKTHLELTNLAFSVEVDKGSHSG